MKLLEKYEIKPDETHGVVLLAKEMRKGKNGELKEFTDTVGYYPSIYIALKNLLNREIEDENIQDVKECIDKIEQTYKKLEIILNK